MDNNIDLRMNEKSYKLFALDKIANWQLKPSTESVKLPPLQRGFVWKAKQVEDLWDSLLRGFPIGSFLLSDDEKGNYFLMDGQQRATSITLGFYYPWEQVENLNMWSLKNYIPTLWIDVNPSIKTESHKFVLRLITQSHPWGYQRKNNGSILSVQDRNEALKLFEENELMKGKGYTSYPSTSVFPYDSDFPIPLSFLLTSLKKECSDIHLWKENVILLCQKFLPETIKTKHSLFSNKTEYISKLNSFDLSEIFEAVKKVMEVEIHSNIVKKELLSETEESDAENPILFVRLNSSGTVLNGDELIYSIYKAFFPDSKDLVEKIGLSFISPPLIISMASRIAQSELLDGKYVKKMDVKSFQNRIKEKPFREKLLDIIGKDKSTPISNAFKNAIDILLDRERVNIPAVLVKVLIKKSPDVFLFLVYWLYKNPNVEISGELRMGVLAKFTILSWFGMDSYKYVEKNWQHINVANFWTTRFLEEDTEKFITIFIPPKLLENYFNNQFVIEKAKYELNLDRYENKELKVKEVNAILKTLNKPYTVDSDRKLIDGIWWEFFHRLFWGKSLILFAQRKYINENFKDFNQIESLQDTNVPWDWDHIYPNSWVYNQKDVKKAIRDWNNCIGNFRALSLGENRSIKTDSPKFRMNELEARNKSFVQDSDFEFWSKINDRIYSDEKVEFHTRAIVNRTLNIYREWWDRLMIDKVIFNQE